MHFYKRHNITIPVRYTKLLLYIRYFIYSNYVILIFIEGGFAYSYESCD